MEKSASLLSSLLHNAGMMNAGRYLLRNALALCLLGLAAAMASAREAWETSKLVGSPEPPSEFVAVAAFPQLSLKRPVCIEREPGTDRLLVIENYAWDTYKAVLKRFIDSPTVKEAEELMVIPGEGELAYSLCFHPKFAENGWVYLGTNGKGPGSEHHSRIVRYTLSRQAPWQIVPDSRLVVIEWPSNGHNGAAAAFGADGMLYVTSGDGTPNSDSNNAGQNTSTLLSKVLRLDVDGAPVGQPYRVPPDNPFVGKEGIRPETWAYGLRNPWRITCDMPSGHIWVGQNGQDLREYANLLVKGANYGWSAYEGSRPFLPDRLKGPAPFTPPTIEHDHAGFRSLTGGFVYRGKKHPQLDGAYLYGDYGTGRVWAAKHDGTKLLWHRELADTSLAIAGFCQSREGDILIADHLGNKIARLEASPTEAKSAAKFPTKLSETGLFSSIRERIPAAGVKPYSVNAPVWHDGAQGEHFLAIPGKDSATLPPAQDGNWPWLSWNFPDGTVLVQTLSLPSEKGPPAPIETRILLKQDADWAAYSYLWNDAHDEAELVEKEGRKVTKAGRDWQVPSRGECVMCHARGANYALGLTAAQLNRPVTADPKLNQLEAFSSEGYLSPLPKPAAELPKLVDPYDPAPTVTERMKAWFAANCAHCHRHEGGGNTKMELVPWLDDSAKNVLGATPQHGGLGLTNAQLVAPGDAALSILPLRCATRGPGQMPPIGSTQPDPTGLALIMKWIQSLPRQ